MSAPTNDQHLRYLTLVRGLFSGLRTATPFQGFLRELGLALKASTTTLTFFDHGREHPYAHFHWQRDRLPTEGADALPPTAVNLCFDIHDSANRLIRLEARLDASCAIATASAQEFRDRLGSDLAEACELYFDLSEAKSRQALFGDMLNRMGLGAMIVDGSGTILHMTTKARDLLARHRLLFDGPLGSGNSVLQDMELRSILATVMARLTRPVTETVADLWPVCRRNANGDVLSLTFRPAPFCDHGVPRRDGTALITLSEASSTDGPSITALSQLFGLTPAEGALAVLLAQGLDLGTASEMLAISKNTAKSQLRMIFSKTRVSRQSSLVRLLLRSVDELIPASPLPEQDAAARVSH